MKTSTALCILSHKGFGTWRQATSTALTELRSVATVDDVLAMMQAELAALKKQAAKAVIKTTP